MISTLIRLTFFTAVMASFLNGDDSAIRVCVITAWLIIMANVMSYLWMHPDTHVLPFPTLYIDCAIGVVFIYYGDMYTGVMYLLSMLVREFKYEQVKHS